jgi:hypothetical protein
MSRTQTDTYEVYTFKELQPEVQAEVIERYQQQAGEFFDSAEFVYENAAEIADLFGLDINTRRSKSGNYSPNIYYSGFCSQGDGACFEGRYSYKPGALAAVKAHAPQDTTLHQIVKDLQDAQCTAFYRLTARTTQRGHYYHSGCMSVDVERTDDADVTHDQEDAITQALRDFADWIYSELETSYDYDTSEENARDYLENDDAEYTAGGDRV